MSSKNKLQIKKTKLFFFYLILGVVFLTLGVFLLPVWSDKDVFFAKWSTEAVNLVLFALVMVLIVFSIIRIDKNHERVVRGIKISELLLLFVLAVLMILQYFKVISFMAPSVAIGFIVWLKGALTVINCYYSNKEKHRKYLFPYLLLGIATITLGTFLMVRGISTLVFGWMISVSVMLLGLFLVVIGIIAIPPKKKKSS